MERKSKLTSLPCKSMIANKLSLETSIESESSWNLSKQG
jgi:hypothetical protein